jgi:hypothetical protein
MKWELCDVEWSDYGSEIKVLAECEAETQRQAVLKFGAMGYPSFHGRYIRIKAAPGTGPCSLRDMVEALR